MDWYYLYFYLSVPSYQAVMHELHMRPSDRYSPAEEGQPLSGTGESGDSALYELQYYDRYRYE